MLSPGSLTMCSAVSDAGLERLWAPDRLAYVQGENRPDSDEAGEGCPFCRAPDVGMKQRHWWWRADSTPTSS